MSSEKNYFTNNLSDFEPNSKNDVKSDNFLKDKIIELSDKIWNFASESQEFPNDIYSGMIGIAYMFWYLSEQRIFSNQQRGSFLQKARSLISRSLNAIVKDGTHSFLRGNSGICLISSLIFDSCNEEEYRDHYLNLFVKFAAFYLPNDVLNQERDTLFDGRAGFVCAALIANNIFKTHIIPTQTLHNLGISAIKSGKYNAIKSKSELPIIYEYNNEIDLSTSHGMSGILLSLLCTPDLIKIHPEFESHIKTGIDHILSQQTPEGNYGNNSDNEYPIEWCGGSSGVSWLMAKAFRTWPQNGLKYKDSLTKCAELVWRKGLSRRGPGLSHGIAGNGYTFLLLFRLTSDPKYIHRAKQFAQFMLSEEFFKECENNHKPYGLYTGWAGTVCYLVDVLKPEEALFPLFIDIFKEEVVEISEDLATLSDSLNHYIIKNIDEED